MEVSALEWQPMLSVADAPKDLEIMFAPLTTTTPIKWLVVVREVGTKHIYSKAFVPDDAE